MYIVNESGRHMEVNRQKGGQTASDWMSSFVSWRGEKVEGARGQALADGSSCRSDSVGSEENKG